MIVRFKPIRSLLKADKIAPHNSANPITVVLKPRARTFKPKLVSNQGPYTTKMFSLAMQEKKKNTTIPSEDRSLITGFQRSR